MFEDTKHLTPPKTTKIYQTVPIKKHNKGIFIGKLDSLTAAEQLVRKGHKVLVLNFANNDSFCDRKFGGKTQEEDLARRTNLFHGMSDELYPISEWSRGGDFPKNKKHTDEPIVLSRDVIVVRDRNNDEITPFKCDIATIAALSIPSQFHDYRKYPDDDQKYEFRNEDDKEITRRKIKHICQLSSHYDVFVTGAWGLGAFNNPEYDVIKLWNTELAKYHASKTYFVCPAPEPLEYFKKYLKH